MMMEDLKMQMEQSGTAGGLKFRASINVTAALHSSIHLLIVSNLRVSGPVGRPVSRDETLVVY